MSGPIFDAIVVGAGIEGSATAYQLAKRGQKTLLLEQFHLPHNRGSSHGASRIIRRAYPQEFYTEMMIHAYKLWAELEQESGVQIYHNCGTLYLGTASELSVVQETLRKKNAPHQTMPHDAILQRFPSFKLPSDYIGIYDIDGGLLLADKALRAFQDQFKQNGGIVRDGQQVVDVIPGDIVTVKTQNESFSGRSIVLALGPYTNILLNRLGMQLPLKVERISVFYWKEKVAGMHSPDKFPCFIDRDEVGASTYSVPCFEYPGLVKVCLHTGPVVNPLARDDCNSGWVRDRMCKYVSERTPWLENTPAIEEACMYTVTPDGDIILDRHPKHDNIIIAAGFSGHGFKLAPIVGKLLSDLVMNQTPNVDMSHFKIARFNKPVVSGQSKL